MKKSITWTINFLYFEKVDLENQDAPENQDALENKDILENQDAPESNI